MKVVIDIPEKMYTSLELGSFGMKYNVYDLAGCVMHGTPLPTGHGELKDTDNVNYHAPKGTWLPSNSSPD